MKRIIINLSIISFIGINIIADDDLKAKQEQEIRTEIIKQKTIETVTLSMANILEELKKKPIDPLDYTSNITSSEKEQDSIALGLDKAHLIASKNVLKLRNLKENEIVGKCYGSIYNDNEIENNPSIDRIVSATQCISELTSIKLLLRGDIKIK